MVKGRVKLGGVARAPKANIVEYFYEKILIKVHNVLITHGWGAL